MTVLAASAAERRTGRPRRQGVASARAAGPATTLYLLPLTAILALVFVVPLGYTVWTALHATSYYEIGAFAGLESFSRLFTDKDLPAQLLTTLIFAMGALVLALPIGLAGALLLERVLRMRRLARAVILLPWLMSQATAGTIWLWFLNPSYGPATHLTTSLGLGPTDVFSSPGSALAGVTVITAWWSYPQAMLLFIGALQTVPMELKEGLRVDGGNAWHSFRHVTIPYIRNTIVSVVVVLLMLYVQMVTIILVTTRGGPLIATETLSMRVYNQMFLDYDLSGASATAVLLFAVNSVLTLAAMRFRRKELL